MARVVDGQLFNRALTGMAGVANTGTSQSWIGLHLQPGQLVCLGRLAWNPDLSARDIAEEWARQTFSNNARLARTTTDSDDGIPPDGGELHDAAGLCNMIFGNGTHYGPGPGTRSAAVLTGARPYYSRPMPIGVGFDRTATGSNAAAQYFPQAAAKFTDKSNLDYPLWFHHVRWGEKLAHRPHPVD